MDCSMPGQPSPVFLPGESQGQGEPGGLLSMGLHRVGHDWGDLAGAAATMIIGTTSDFNLYPLEYCFHIL